ncbi:MAG TPA: FecR domain-containing protein, partial [Phnomibacter sp.]|nr:FecR domain-containing protein [Phnomibacter sp.]
MIPTKTEIASIIQDLLQGNTDPEHQQRLKDLLEQDEAEQMVREVLGELMEHEGKDVNEYDSTKYEAIFRDILSVDKPAAVVPFFSTRIGRFLKYAAAIAVIAVAGSAIFKMMNGIEPKQAPAAEVAATYDVAPGRDGAILKLEDGTEVVLDEMADGVVNAIEGSVVKLENGKLVYTATKSSGGEVHYHTLYTPKGRQYMLQLPDGSDVWMNASSSIRFPTHLDGKERVVEMTGELYFEIAPRFAENAPGKKVPFIVELSNNTRVEVLGTHFNINAYDDEAVIRTTLVEGSVRVHHRGQQALLVPGKQAEVAASPSVKTNIVLRDADVTRVLAWKNGV